MMTKKKIPAYSIAFLLNRKPEVLSIVIGNNSADKSITKDRRTCKAVIIRHGERSGGKQKFAMNALNSSKFCSSK